MARLEIELGVSGAGSVGKSLSDIENNLSKLNLSYAKTIQEISKVTQVTNELEGELRNLNSQLKSGTISQSQFDKESAEVSTALASARVAAQQYQSQLSSLQGTINQNKNALNNLGDETKKLKPVHKDFQHGVASANGVALEFGRIVQDIPYGMQGIANNLQQLTTNFGYYATRAKEAAAANGQVLTSSQLMKGVFSSLISPANLLTLGISLITAGWVAYEKYTQKANKATEEQEKAIEKQKGALDKYIATLTGLSGVQAQAISNYSQEIAKLDVLYGILTSGTATRAEQQEALSQANKLYPETFSNLTQEALLANEGADAYDRLRASIIQKGIADAAQKLSAGSSEKLVKNIIAQQTAFEDTNKEQKKYNDLVKLRNILQNESEKRLGQQITMGGQTVKVTRDNSGSIVRLNALISQQYRIAKPLVDTYREYGEEIKKATSEVNEYNKIATDNFVVTEKQTGIINDLQSKIKVLEQARPFLESEADINKNNDALRTLREQLNKYKEESSVVPKKTNQAIKDSIDLLGTFGSKLEAIIGKSDSSASQSGLIGVDLEIEKTRQQYANLFKSVNDLETESLRNTELTEQERNSIIASSFEARQKLANNYIKEQEDNEQKRIDSTEEIEQTLSNISLDYTRRLTEKRSQIMIRALNDEFKAREKLANDTLQNESERLAAQAQLQEEYWQRLELVQKFAQIEDLSLQLGDAVGNAFEGLLTNGTDIFTSLVAEFKKAIVKMVAQAAALSASNLFGKLLGVGANVATGGSGGLFKGLLKGFLGFQSGGYTGNIPRNQVAGVVHGQEMVMDAKATRRYGSLLNSMQNGTFNPASMSTVMPYISDGNREIAIVGEARIENTAIVISYKRGEKELGRYGT